MQSSHLFTFDVVVITAIFLGWHFQWSHHHHLYLLQYIFKFKFLRNTDVVFVLDFICTSRPFLWAFLHSFGLSNIDVFMADSAASPRGLAPCEASRKTVPDGWELKCRCYHDVSVSIPQPFSKIHPLGLSRHLLSPILTLSWTSHLKTMPSSVQWGDNARRVWLKRID